MTANDPSPREAASGNAIPEGALMSRARTRLSWLPLVLLLAAGCGGQRPKAVTVKGSDTMVILGQRWAENYMDDAPRARRPGHRRRLGHRHRRAHQRDRPTSASPRGR